MGGEIAYSFRRSDLGIDRTTKSADDLFRFPAISQFGYVPDDLLFICPLFRGIFIPPENPNVWNSFAFEFKETSLAEICSYNLRLFRSFSRSRLSLGRFVTTLLGAPFTIRSAGWECS